MSYPLKFSFTFKITSPYRIDLPPEVANGFYGGSTLMAAWRKYRGFTIREFAKRTGMKWTTYAKHDIGTHKPSRHTLQKYADALEISIEKLVE